MGMTARTFGYETRWNLALQSPSTRLSGTTRSRDARPDLPLSQLWPLVQHAEHRATEQRREIFVAFANGIDKQLLACWTSEPHSATYSRSPVGYICPTLAPQLQGQTPSLSVWSRVHGRGLPMEA